MSEITTLSRAWAQTLLRRLFVAFVLPWAFITAQAASAHIVPVPAEAVVSAGAGKSFVVDVRNGVAAVKVERGGAQPGKSAPPVAIVSVSSRSSNSGTPQRTTFSPPFRSAASGSAPSNYWSRGPPRGAPAFETIKSI